MAFTPRYLAVGVLVPRATGNHRHVFNLVLDVTLDTHGNLHVEMLRTSELFAKGEWLNVTCYKNPEYKGI